jgi:Amt family ammonium transporter
MAGPSFVSAASAAVARGNFEGAALQLWILPAFLALFIPAALLIKKKRRQGPRPSLSDRDRQQVLDGMGDAVLLIDANDLKVIEANKTAMNFFSQGGNTVLGQSLLELLHLDEEKDSIPRVFDSGSFDTYVEIEDENNPSKGVPLEGIILRSRIDGREVYTISFRDITNRLANEKTLRRSERRYRSFFENTGTATIIVDELGMISQVNSEFESLTGMPRDTVEGTVPIMSIISDNKKDERDTLASMCLGFRDETSRKMEFEIETNEGAQKQVWATVSCIPETSSTMLSLTDISSLRSTQRDLGEQRAYFERLFEHSPQGIICINNDGFIIEVNREFEKLFGYNREKIIGSLYQDLLLTCTMQSESKAIFDGIKSGRKVRKETYRKNSKGELIPVVVLCYPVDITTEDRAYFVIYEDISERKAYEKQLARQAFYDALTDLPNRSLFHERLEWAMQRAARKEEYAFAVFMVDLNRFKWINDSLGHQAGDQVLKEISRRIEGSVRTIDTVSRLGGDEFAVILEDISDMEEIIHIAERIESNIRQPILVEGHEIFPSSSIGIVSDAGRFGSPKEIMRNADVAMYRAKESAGGYVVYDGVMHKHFLETVRIESELRKSIANNELELHYQPIVSVADEKTKGFEALVRWHHPERGLVMPGSFIPVAEQTGLITSIGSWVLEQACRALQNWHCDGAEDLFVSVNISTQQFMKRDLVKEISSILVCSGVDPGKLKLEITESTIMQDAESAVDKLRNIKSLGVQVAVDDFGTGYSSLSYLQKFPIDALKIDRAFISGDGDSSANAEIVQAVIALAGNLGLHVVAEGVEESHQLDRLRSLKCEYAQGYLFAKPMPLCEVGAFLEKNEAVCVEAAGVSCLPTIKHPMQSKFEEDTEPL